ncbi:hypothetical protein D1B33_03705 [Lysinibacillus yapensis]|uniref:SLH domain-containing protein n=1 Tax=Ureibacillus yapensis TaxID=2304605 RepID=A0A396SFY7_9BACL|nr:S-layer homology domain-containing protein [Lysinibacillus yapensis]RHW39962.1 hypothetical protein D1B33_03705 [Lysinibacillus yapensis]
MAKKHKFFATTATAALVASAIVPVASAADLKDFNNVSSWAQEAVQYLTDNNILQGDQNGYFNPTGTLTRAQAAEVLYKALGLEATGTEDFSDVAPGQWFYDAVVATSPELFEGMGNGKFKPQDKLTRAQAAKVIVLAYGLEGEADLSKFRDAATVPGWATEYFSTAVANGVINGKGTRLAPQDEISRQEFATMVYRTIEGVLEVESVSAINTITVKEGEEVKFPETVEVTLSNGEKAQKAVEWDTAKLDTKKAGEYTVKGDVEGTELEATVKVVVEAVNPGVTAVSALNLKQVEVTFNKEVDAETAENEANYTLTGGLTVADAKANGNKVVLTLTANANQQASEELTVANVKDAAGTAVAKTTKAVKFFDATAPTVSSVQAIGPKTLKVQFSEPLKTAPSYKLDNGTLAIVNTTWTAGDSEATLTLGTNLTEGSHNLEVSGGSDYANFAIEKATNSFNYVLDTVAPTATVKSASETQVVLEFSEDVLNADDANVEYYHTFKGTAAYKASDVTVDGNEVTLTFENPLPGNAKIFVSYKDEKGTKIQDVTGNVFEAVTLNATVVADTTAPTVSKVVATDNTKIDVTFSETVEGADNKANYTLKDAAGKTVAITSATNLNGNTYRLAVSPLNGGSYTLTVKNVTDASIRENKIADFTTNVSVNDVVAPTIVDTDSETNGIQVKQIASDKIKVEFSEVMKADSITNKANYKYNGEALTGDDTVTAVDGNKAVIITVEADNVDGDSTVTVGRVQDADGNYIENFETALDVVALANVDVAAVEVTGKNSIRLTFDEVITNATVNDFEYTLDTNAKDQAGQPAVVWATPAAISTSVSDGKTYITLTVNEIEDTTAANVAVRTTDAKATESAENVFGTPVLFSTTGADDKYAPMLESATFAGTVGDKNDDTVTITFSEDLYVASVQESDFTVEGYTIKSIATKDDTVTLTVADNTAGTTTPKVTLVGEVEDSERNATKGTKEVTATTVTAE